MLGDFDLISHTFPDDEITIYPIADVHLGAIEHAESEWQAFLTRVKQENAYLIIAGDMLNNSTRGVRFANPFDEAMRPRVAKKRMVEYLEPLASHLLCYLDGNHEARSSRDSDVSIGYDICARLCCEDIYRENVAFMSIGVGTRNTSSNPKAVYTFMVEHGSGGGVLPGSVINKNERTATQVVDGIDCLVVGHHHRGMISKPAKIVVDAARKRVSVKHVVVISCVSWLNYGGYAARSQLLPAQIADPQKLTLIGNKDRKRIITTW